MNNLGTMNESGSSKVFKGLRSQSVITILLAVIQLVYFSLMSRLLTKEVFGIFAVITAITAILTEISNAGLGSAVIQKKNVSSVFINTAFTLSAIIGSFFSILLALLAKPLSQYLIGDNELIIPFCIMAVSLFFSTVNSITYAMFMRRLNFFMYGCAQITSLFFSSLVGVIMAYRGTGVYSLIMAIFLNAFGLFIITFYKERKNIHFGIKKQFIKEILSYGGWLTASGVVRSLYNQMDRLITTKWISIALLGTYTRASGFVVNITSNVNSIFDTILFPIISGIQDDKERLKASYVKAADLIFVMSFPFCFTMILMADPIIRIFLGENWLDTMTLFRIVSLSILIHPFCRIGDSFFRSIGIVKQYFMVRVAICAMSIVLIYIGCRYAGILGLAISYVISRVFDAIIKMTILNYHIGVSAADLLRRPVINFLLVFFAFVLSFIPNCYSESVVTSILSSVFFVTILLVGMLVRPKIFGETVYTYLYCPIKKNVLTKC